MLDVVVDHRLDDHAGVPGVLPQMSHHRPDVRGGPVSNVGGVDRTSDVAHERGEDVLVGSAHDGGFRGEVVQHGRLRDAGAFGDGGQRRSGVAPLSDDRLRPPSRRIRISLSVIGLVALVVVFGMRKPAPIGHWDNADGQDRFLRAHRTAFAVLPTPAETIDVRTDFGFVRVYRFASAGAGTTGGGNLPLLLLPGRASATPVWADNVPELLRIGNVYTVGLSIGGWTAVNLALHRPDHIASMTVVDPVYVFADMPLGTIVRSIPAALPWLPGSWRDSFNSYTAGGVPVGDEPVADMIEAGMQHYRLRLPQPTRISKKRLGRLDLPVLAIIAGKSVMRDPQAAVETARRAWTSRCVRPKACSVEPAD
ncbi:hypothetical protein [Plantactinospora sp. B5E13]|uniref:hypothetical protein n=1 Tax=unclassified Plantactinospora TaxID=2631981 RepID=UPI00325DB933